MWYTGTTCLLKKKLKITQNKVIRFVLGLPSRSHIGPTKFSGANMLPVPLRVDQLKLNHMYSIINGIALSYLKGEIAIADHTGHVTRSGNRVLFRAQCEQLCYISICLFSIQVLNSGMLFPLLLNK